MSDEALKPYQDWGPCPKCGGRYDFGVLGGYGLDAFKVTYVECRECGFRINWQDAPNGDAPTAWMAEAKGLP